MACPVAYTHVLPSPEPELYENHKGEVHVKSKITVKCAWDDRITLMNWLYTEDGCYLNDAPSALVRRVVPHGHGTYSGTFSTPTFLEAILEIYYSSEGPRWVNSRYVDERFDPAEFIVYPLLGAYWDTGGATKITTENSCAMRVPGVVWTIEEGQLVTYPSDAFNYAGMTNAGTKTGLAFSSYVFGAGTALYFAPHVACHSDYSHGTRYVVKYRSHINRLGWNKAYRPGYGWVPMYNEAGDLLYPFPQTW